MKVLEPLRIQSSPSRTAVLLRAARSEPPLGSVIAMAVMISPEQKPGSQRAQVHQIRGHAVGVDPEAGGRRGGELGQLLAQYRVEPEVTRRRTAIDLGHLQTEQPLLAGLDPGLAIDDPAIDELLGARLQAAFDELASRLPERFMVSAVQVAWHVILRVALRRY